MGRKMCEKVRLEKIRLREREEWRGWRSTKQRATSDEQWAAAPAPIPAHETDLIGLKIWFIEYWVSSIEHSAFSIQHSAGMWEESGMDWFVGMFLMLLLVLIWSAELFYALVEHNNLAAARMDKSNDIIGEDVSLIWRVGERRRCGVDLEIGVFTLAPLIG